MQDSKPEGHFDHPLLTPVYGGHVWPGTWEGLAGFASARCAACGREIKHDGQIIVSINLGPESEDNLCPGWQRATSAPVLPRLVRAITREAPNDKPNGPLEEAIEAAHEAHLAMIAEHDGQRMIVQCDRVLADGNAIRDLVDRTADQDRALRLALEHDEATQEEEPPIVCPGCYAINDEPHAGYCPDEAIRIADEDSREREEIDGDDEPDDDY